MKQKPLAPIAKFEPRGIVHDKETNANSSMLNRHRLLMVKSSIVLLVRPTGLSKRKRPIEMCFAQDESSDSAAAIKQVASFGWGASTHIDVVGVFTLPFIYSEIPHELDLAELKKTIEQSVDLAAEQLRNLSPHVQTHILYGNHAGDALVEFVKKHGG